MYMKGMIVLSVQQILDQLIKDKAGIIQTSDAVGLGVSKPTLYKYLKKNNFKKLAHGIYVAPNTRFDPLYILSLRSNQIIFSHDTALYLNGVISYVPSKHSLTLKTGYNPTSLQKEGVRVYTIKSEYHEMGLIHIETTYNNRLPTYNIERTICDMVRSRNSIDNKIFQDALKGYAQRTARDIKLLMEYARTLHVDKILVNYLNIFL